MTRTMSLNRDIMSRLPLKFDNGTDSRPSSSGQNPRARRHTATASDGSRLVISRPIPRTMSSNNLHVHHGISVSDDVGDEYRLSGSEGNVLAEDLRRGHRTDNTSSLADFLKSHQPPPDNFMSIPYDQYDRGRWSKIRHIGKRSKSVPKPQTIRLPDSAVAGKTIGGHRHIAISIPLEASPFKDGIDSQYAADQEIDTRPGGPPRLAPIPPLHTFMNEKGVVTVLRTVDEDREPSAGQEEPLGSHPPLPWNRSHRQSSSMGRASVSTGRQSRGSVYGRHTENVAAGPSATPIFDQYRTVADGADSQGTGPSESQSPKPFQKSAYPARGSSMSSRPTMIGEAISIDGVISYQGSNMGTSGSPLEGPATAVVSDASSASNSPKRNSLGRARRTPSPLVLSATAGGLIGEDKNNRLKPLTPALAESPLLPPNDDEPPTPNSIRNRKNLVRDRKRRDIEAMKNAKQKSKGKVSNGSNDMLDEQSEMPSVVVGSPDSRKSDATIKPAVRTSGNSRASELSLCPIMIVVDSEPSPETETRLQAPPQPTRLPSFQSLDSFETANDLVSEEPQSRAASPAPSISESVRPQRASDRTSLARRREWNASREQERKAREAKDAARAKARHLLAAGLTHEQVKGSQTDKEIIRLYEAYRDHKMREMERRLRRLERNGDVWLRALVPVLDNVNRNMLAGQDPDMEGDYASEDGNLTNTIRRSPDRRVPRSVARSDLGRKTSLSQSRLMEELVRRRAEGEYWSGGSAGADSGSASDEDDTTGFGTIEPLVRELAGEGRRRQRRAERQAQTYHTM